MLQGLASFWIWDNLLIRPAKSIYRLLKWKSNFSLFGSKGIFVVPWPWVMNSDLRLVRPILSMIQKTFVIILKAAKLYSTNRGTLVYRLLRFAS